MPIMRSCTTCGDAFPISPSQNKIKYMSCKKQSCKDQNRIECHNRQKSRIQKKCVICQKVFEVRKSEVHRFVVCSEAVCKKKNAIKRQAERYSKSQTEESKAKRSATFKSRRLALECACGCGEPLSITLGNFKKRKNGKIYLNREHYENWFNGPNCTFWKGGRDDYYGPNWYSQRRICRVRDKVCQICGSCPTVLGQELDVHHITPRRTFLQEEFKLANDLTNLISLCHPCHMLVEWKGVELARHQKWSIALKRGLILP